MLITLARESFFLDATIKIVIKSHKLKLYHRVLKRMLLKQHAFLHKIVEIKCNLDSRNMPVLRIKKR